jgi:hypothetical protein
MKHCKFNTTSAVLLLILSAPLVSQAQARRRSRTIPQSAQKTGYLAITTALHQLAGIGSP